MSASEYLGVLGREFNITGETGKERLSQLKKLSTEGIAILIETINKNLQSSADSLISDKVVSIGEEATLPVGSRYDVFTTAIDELRSAPDDTNPDRIADTLALTVLLLHPFKDGNGRTARLIGLTFRDDIGGDTFEFEKAYDLVTESREYLRDKGVYIDGYIPYLPEGSSRSDPQHVSDYIRDLLTKDTSRLCYNPFNRGIQETLK